MSPDPFSHRYGPRWLYPAIEMDDEELLGEPDAARHSTAKESGNDPAIRDLDEALEQIVSDECTVCPICGAIVDRNGHVMN